MTRSIWKGPFFSASIIREIEVPGIKNIKIYSRNSVIHPSFVGRKVEIHNGRSFHSILVKDEMVGHKFGEFSPTRQPYAYKSKKQKKKKKR